LVYLLLDSGLRINELLNIKITNIDFNDTFTTPSNIYIEDTKTGKPRYAPFSKFSSDDLKELIALDPNREYLFYNFLKKRRLTKDDVKLFYRRLSKKTGIDHIHSHRFRKTFASLLAENGMPVDIIQKLIGHSRITTTMIYIQYDQKYALSQYNQYNSWLN
jgi:integrase